MVVSICRCFLGTSLLSNFYLPFFSFGSYFLSVRGGLRHRREEEKKEREGGTHKRRNVVRRSGDGSGDSSREEIPLTPKREEERSLKIWKT